MSDHVDEVADLETGQYVRVETDLDTTVDARVTGRPYASDTRVRIELAVDSDDGDYRLGATGEGGEWTPVTLRRADRGSTVWATMGTVTSVEVLGESEPADSTADVE